MAVKDSLSKCTTYSNPYDTKSYPIRTQQNGPSHLSTSFTKDVLEISEGKLKKDAQAHLDSAASRIPTGLYVVICKVGKYTFLALFIPPYFLLYTMPKWLFSVAAPAAFEAVSRPIVRLAKMIKKAIETTIHSIWQPVMHFFQRVNAKIKQMTQLILSANRKAIKAFKSSLAAISRPFQEAFQRVFALLRKLRDFNPFSRMKQFSASFRQVVANVFNQSLESFDRFKQKIANRLKKNQEWVLSKGALLFQNLKNTFQSSSQMANRAVAWLGQMAKAPFQAISRGYQGVKNRIKESVQPFKTMLSHQTERLQFFIKRSGQKFKEGVTSLLRPFHRLGQSTARQFKQLFQKGSAAAERMIAILPQGVQRFLQESRMLTLLRQFIGWLFRLILLPLKVFGRLVKGAFNAVIQVPLNITKRAVLIKSSISGFWGFITRFFEKIQRGGVYVLKKTVYWFLITILLFGFTFLFIGRSIAKATLSIAQKQPQQS